MSRNALHPDGSDQYSLRRKIYMQIREDILSGRYKKGEAVIESQISKEFGVSRTPVREALRQLELEELVSIIPNRGAVVEGINPSDIHDIYEIRSRIEGMAARKCAESLNQDILNELDEIIMLSEFHLAKKNMEQVFKLDTRFHDLLYEGSNSRMLKHLLKNFYSYAKRVRKVSLSIEGRAEESIKEHKAIVEAIRNRDKDLAEELTNEHIRYIGETVARKHIAENIEKINGA